MHAAILIRVQSLYGSIVLSGLMIAVGKDYHFASTPSPSTLTHRLKSERVQQNDILADGLHVLLTREGVNREDQETQQETPEEENGRDGSG